ncbi:12502_t:CDS:2, partial [Entrophospora sp. SA101]
APNLFDFINDLETPIAKNYKTEYGMDFLQCFRIEPRNQKWNVD